MRVRLAEFDVLRSEGEALVAKLRAAAVPVESEVFMGVPPGFVRATEYVAKARGAMANATAWMRRVGF